MTSAIRVVFTLAAALSWSGVALAQTGAGVCGFSGSLTFSPPSPLVPSVCQSPAGCERFSVTGTLSGPACGSFAGSVSTRRGLVLGTHNCAGNVHAGVLDHSGVGVPFSFAGVCAAGICVGGGYATFGALQYELWVDPGAAGSMASQCTSGALGSVPLGGLVTGGATN